jgi:hypothetical protein
MSDKIDQNANLAPTPTSGSAFGRLKNVLKENTKTGALALFSAGFLGLSAWMWSSVKATLRDELTFFVLGNPEICKESGEDPQNAEKRRACAHFRTRQAELRRMIFEDNGQVDYFSARLHEEISRGTGNNSIETHFSQNSRRIFFR